jgi:hypothetical protein
MSLMKRKTPEELEAEVAEKELQRRKSDELKRRAQLEQDQRAFDKSPTGRARSAFKRQDHVFQFSIDVMNQKAVIAVMVGSSTTTRSSDPVAVLNSVCREGWELVNGSFVFVEQGQQSRDKLLSSGQNVAVKGEIVGYYLFKRCEGNLKTA